MDFQGTAAMKWSQGCCKVGTGTDCYEHMTRYNRNKRIVPCSPKGLVNRKWTVSAVTHLILISAAISRPTKETSGFIRLCYIVVNTLLYLTKSNAGQFHWCAPHSGSCILSNKNAMKWNEINYTEDACTEAAISSSISCCSRAAMACQLNENGTMKEWIMQKTRVQVNDALRHHEGSASWNGNRNLSMKKLWLVQPTSAPRDTPRPWVVSCTERPSTTVVFRYI